MNLAEGKIRILRHFEIGRFQERRISLPKCSNKSIMNLIKHQISFVLVS